jgi:hypothetical protein
MHFGKDLTGFWTGDLSIRLLLVLIKRLLRMHGRSALAEAMLGQQASWSNIEYVLADIADKVEAGNYLFLSAHKSEGYVMPNFTPYPRPGLDLSQSVTIEPEPNWASVDDIRDLFRQMHGG